MYDSPSKTRFIASAYRLTNITLLTLISYTHGSSKGSR